MGKDPKAIAAGLIQKIGPAPKEVEIEIESPEGKDDSTLDAEKASHLAVEDIFDAVSKGDKELFKSALMDLLHILKYSSEEDE